MPVNPYRTFSSLATSSQLIIHICTQDSRLAQNSPEVTPEKCSLLGLQRQAAPGDRAGHSDGT